GIPAFVRAVARARPDGVFLSGFIFDGDPIGPMVRALRKALPLAQFIAPDGFAIFPDATDLLGPAAEGMYITEPFIAPRLLKGAGRAFAGRFAKQLGSRLYEGSVYAAQAAAILLDAIGRSDGTRASVTRALFATHVRGGLLGSFSITPTGDTTAGGVTALRI